MSYRHFVFHVTNEAGYLHIKKKQQQISGIGNVTFKIECMHSTTIFGYSEYIYQRDSESPCNIPSDWLDSHTL